MHVYCVKTIYFYGRRLFFFIGVLNGRAIDGRKSVSLLQLPIIWHLPQLDGCVTGATQNYMVVITVFITY